MAAPYAQHEVTLSITGTPASQSYLDITAGVMTDFGAVIRREGYTQFQVSNQNRYTGHTDVIKVTIHRPGTSLRSQRSAAAG